MNYIISFLVLSIILSLFWYRKDYKTVLTIFGISFVIPTLIVISGLFLETYDVEIWNGKVTNKEKDRVSCSHSYSCNCRTSCSGSGKNRSCSTVCDTCYEHSHDFDWNVKSTIGAFTISRLDRQGLITPPRWETVKIGEPVSQSHSYVNYIKAAKNNVLNRQGTKITYVIPTYPDSVYDYYKIDRAVSIDSAVSNLKIWSSEISKALIDLGPAKQINLVMVFTKQPQYFSEQLNAAWLGGKKNDVIIVIGTKDGIKAEWVDVISWTKREDFKIQLRDSIMEESLEPEKQLKLISKNITDKFERRQMKEFEYLQYDIEPNEYYLIAAYISMILPSFVYLIYNIYYINSRRRVRKFDNGGKIRRFFNF